jgi:hypothetical protein
VAGAAKKTYRIPMDIGAIIFWGFLLGVPIVAFYNLGGGANDTKSDKAVWAIGAVIIGIAFVAGILVLGS